MATSNTPADASAAICAKEEEEEAEEEKEEADAFVGRGHKTPPQTRCTRLREAEAVIDAKVGKHSKDRRPSILAGGGRLGGGGGGEFTWCLVFSSTSSSSSPSSPDLLVHERVRRTRHHAIGARIEVSRRWREGSQTRLQRRYEGRCSRPSKTLAQIAAHRSWD